MYKLIDILADASSLSVWIKDLELKYTYVNDKYALNYGMKAVDFISHTDMELFNKSFIPDTIYEKIKSQGEILEYICEYNNKFYNFRVMPIIEDGKIISIAGIEIPSNALEKKDKLINTNKGLLDLILESLKCNIFFKDTECKYQLVSRLCQSYNEAVVGRSIIGLDDFEVQADKKLAEFFYEDDKMIMNTKKGNRYETPMMVGDELNYFDIIKDPVIDKEGNVLGVVGLVNDITERKLLEEELKKLSRTDKLTGAYNRNYYEEIIAKIGTEENMPLSIIMIDCNGLKLLNDTFGHHQGDLLLNETVDILKKSTNNKDVFRIGGDEFVVLCPNTNEVQCSEIVHNIFEESKKRIINALPVSVSIGNSTVNSIDENIDEAIREADKMLYRLKLQNKKEIQKNMRNYFVDKLEQNKIINRNFIEYISHVVIRVGNYLNLSHSEIEELLSVVKYYDIGKIAINESILNNIDNLTEGEKEELSSYVEKGYNIIKITGMSENIAKGILFQNEKYDGKGYPFKLKKEEIPLYARIVSIIDAAEEFFADDNINIDQYIKKLQEGTGTKYDPNLVPIVIDCLRS